MRYAVAGTLVLTVWVLTIALSGPVSLAVAVSLLAGTVLLALFLRDRLKERRAAAALEKALREQAERERASARPDLAEDLAKVEKELGLAVQALKRSRGGASALYRLPWFLIIGPPGCGKTTALRSSGLDFPFESSSGGPLRGVGGTRQCDLWLANQAVMLDTAGRWTEEDDRDEWLGFLDLLRKHRPRFPLNGVIAAVSIDEVGSAREDEVHRLADRMRARIDEVQERLGVSLPVYVLFTKCDLVVGFTEAFSDLSRQDRGQIWGFTLPVLHKAAPLRETLGAHFETLLASLGRHVEHRMGEERNIYGRDLLFAFPEQLAALTPNLTEMVARLAVDNVYRETPRLRGVYFTSGTQEGRPVDRVIRKMATAFGVPEAVSEPASTSKSYFLRDVFEQVMFHDVDVAVRTPKEIARQRTRTYLAAAALLAVAAGIATVPTYAWANNRGLLVETRDAVDASRPLIAARSPRTVAPEELALIRQRFELLATHQQDGPPLGYRFGMYQSSVYEPVRATYVSAVERRVVRPLLARDAQTLAAWTSGTATEDDGVETVTQRYEALKLHLLLTGPREETEPAWSATQRTYVVERLVAQWAADHHLGRHDPLRDAMRRDVATYVDAVSHDGATGLDRDVALVAATRAQLRARMESSLAVDHIVATVAQRRPAMTLTRLLGDESRAFTADHAVPAAFTRDAYREDVEALFEGEIPAALEDDWVVGEPPADDDYQAERRRDERVRAIEEAYFRRYAAEWRRFIDGLGVRPVTDDNRAAVLGGYLSGEPAAIVRLFVAMGDELTLFEAATPETGLTIDGELIGRRVDQQIVQATGLRSDQVRDLRHGSQRDLAREDDADTRLRYGAFDLRRAFAGWLSFAETPRSRPGRSRSRAAEYAEQVEYLLNAVRDPTVDPAPRRVMLEDVSRHAVEEATPEFREPLQRLLDAPLR